MKNKVIYVLLRWSALILIILSICLFVSYKVRNIIFTAAKSKAENIIISAADKAVIKVLKDNDITYSDISVISRDQSGNITGIEIDTNKINLLKSSISEEMYRITESKGHYKLNIPLGTLLNYEYTSGYGPKLKFKMKLAHSEIMHYESRFEDAGINNVLHQIVINIKVNYSVLAAGASKSYNLSTEIIAAQTVIAGKIPESFTNVDESDKSDVADDIFNFKE